MSSPLIIATLAAGLSGFSPSAIDVPSLVVNIDGDCGAAAAQVVAKTGGELLSAQPTADGKCVVTVLIPDNGGRPKKVTVRVPM